LFFSAGAALCLFSFTAKKSIQLKEKRQCAACGPDKKHDRKKQQKGWRAEGQKRQG
jgi:hypothetical protein